MRKILQLFIFLFCGALTLGAHEYAVVVSAQNEVDELPTTWIRDVFLLKRSFYGDTSLLPVNVLGDPQIRLVFEEKILGMSRQSLKRYWVQNHFQGITPPPTQASLESMRSFILNVDGAIGYLPLDMVDERLKVIHEF